MDSEQGRPVDDVKKLREAYLKEGFLKHLKILSFVEESPDKTYTLEISKDDGAFLGVIGFRKWKHGEVMNLHKLPFYHKIIMGEELTPEEKLQYRATKAEMVGMAVENRRLWEEMLTVHPDALEQTFGIISILSGLSPKFMEELEEFMNEDFGYNYGNLWFYLFHKTPSEIAELPETDVQTINMWLYKWSERVGRQRT